MLIVRTLNVGRKAALGLLLLLLAAVAVNAAPAKHKRSKASVPVVAAPVDHSAQDAMLEDIEHRTFNFFWDTANPDNGLIPDRWPDPPFSSIAAVGFALTAYPIGVERGYITRAQAIERVRRTLTFFHNAPQGPDVNGVAGYHGFFYHFLDMKTGTRFHDVELSTIDTALLMAGVLFCRQYFDGEEPAEFDIRRLADDLYWAVDWDWATSANGAVAMGWKPETGLFRSEWLGFNEGMLIYLLGLGSPTHPLTTAAWKAWTVTYAINWRTEFGQTYLAYPSLFVHQFTPLWVDLKGLRDAFMTTKKSDYFENTRRATYANRAYSIANPDGWLGYGANMWGISASDGPGTMQIQSRGQLRQYRWYVGRGIKLYDDGTLAPNAALGSLPFAPEIVLPAVEEMRSRFGDHLYQKYGFVDAFNENFDGTPTTGTVVPNLGWFDDHYVGIDEGLIIGMIENYRSGLIWKTMRTSLYLRTGLKRAGFHGGWLDQPQ